MLERGAQLRFDGAAAVAGSEPRREVGVAGDVVPHGGEDAAVAARPHVGVGVGADVEGRAVVVLDIRNAGALDFTPTGPGEIRHVRVPGLVAHEDAGFLADSTRIFVTGRDAAGKRATWLTDVQGREPRLLPLPEGRILRQNTFFPDGTRFVASCPEAAGSYGSCFYDTLHGNPTPVPGAQKTWVAIAVDTQGRLYYRDRSVDKAESLLRLDTKSGKATTLAELAPRDRAGVFGVLDVNVSADGEAWAYTFQRRLSDLHIVAGLK